MAKTTKSVSFLVVFISCVLILDMANSLCGRASDTWHGICFTESHCDRKCKTWEKAVHGTCHGIINKKCYCYYKDCNEASTLGEILE
uniref:Defensin 6 n=1 Tax=Datisca glomerata TaxID=34297 RepID=A0A6M3RDY3_DATGL|nr:defensin 6 [Datisca glomerata]